jgi:hypothetical protein
MIAGLLGLLLAAEVRAAPATDSPRQYDIELLVFRNLVEDDAGEVWPRDYSEWFEQAAQTPETSSSGAPEVTWLTESSYHLKAEQNALKRSSRYRPVAYFAWRQVVLDRDQAQPLQLPVPAHRSGAYVDGSVRVAVERYLHLYLDLQLHLPGPAVDASAPAGEPAAFGEPVEALPEIRLTEQRRMRSKELHYFDNPRFGVIALITPYEAPPEPAAAGGDSGSAVPEDPAKAVTAP